MQSYTHFFFKKKNEILINLTKFFLIKLQKKCGVIFENTFYKIEMYHIANNTIKTHYSALNVISLL